MCLSFLSCYLSSRSLSLFCPLKMAWGADQDHTLDQEDLSRPAPFPAAAQNTQILNFCRTKSAMANFSHLCLLFILMEFSKGKKHKL